jgi:iron complex outermembrane recepter protein
MRTKICRATPGRESHAHVCRKLSLSIAAVIAGMGVAHAQQTATGSTPVSAPAEESTRLDLVTVTARKREETLVEVPVAVSTVSAEVMERSGLESVADAAPFTPGLNINSDSAGRAFISIRGIGTALQAGVQPGVGIFQDGIYVRETSYVNNPLLDIERIEVLRGPQGTLYGKNTLGGAINIITRPPGNQFEGRVAAGYGDDDNSFTLGARISGPLGERLRGKLAISTRDSDGFFRNDLTGERADATSSEQAALSLGWDVSDAVYLTTNAYYLDFEGPGTYYSHVDGPTDYRTNIRLNVNGRQAFVYEGANIKAEFPLAALNTEVTAILAWDERRLESSGDGDFLALDIVRARGEGETSTVTNEWRFDTTFSDRFRTLIGVFASRDSEDVTGVQRLVPAGFAATSYARREGDTRAVFGTGIWRLADSWEASLGIRLDREKRWQETASEVSLSPGVVTSNPRRTISSSELQPRLSLTRFFDSGWMTYGSVAKGYRGGGFNAPSVPAQFSTYGGDTVWTYELGAKFASTDGRWQWANALYYNDYRDFIGQNALIRGPGGGLVSIDLNLGNVTSWGIESEVSARVTDRWTVNASVTGMRARITDQSGWIAVTGAPLATDRLLFQPDWNLTIGSDVMFPTAAGTFNWFLGMTAKGSRPGSSFDPVTPSILEGYSVWNTSLTYRRGPLTTGLYFNNLFNEKYFESYIDGSLLAALGLLDQNLGILGNPRNAGVRLQYTF